MRMSFSESGSPVFIDPSLRKRGLHRPDPAPRYSPLLSSVEVVKRIVPRHWDRWKAATPRRRAAPVSPGQRRNRRI